MTNTITIQLTEHHERQLAKVKEKLESLYLTNVSEETIILAVIDN